MVYSVDSNDCEKYNLQEYQTLYSIDQNMRGISIIRDLYFCGASKDRCTTLIQIAEKAKEYGVLCSMDIVGGANIDNNLTNSIGVHFLEQGQNLDYLTVLKNELQAKCILEVCQKGQAALTLRPYEAVAYNRKLLSNNRTILDYKYYDKRYMRYFEKTEDIDWEWVKSECSVNYGYKGEFSPLGLISDMSNRLR